MSYTILAAANLKRHPSGYNSNASDDIGGAKTFDEAQALAKSAQAAGERDVQIRGNRTNKLYPIGVSRSEYWSMVDDMDDLGPAIICHDD